ncbi:MAG: hypothetical protein AAF683_03765 [Pseudomonadota bacterium]
MPSDVTRKFVGTGSKGIRRAPRPNKSGATNKTTSKGAERLQARAIKRIRDSETGELVGWLYQWNTGAHSLRWKSEPRKKVIYD